MSKLHSTKRVLTNTLFLYFRTILVMVITIFTSRIILDTLGIENYGIYNVVGGFVTAFSILSGTMTAASQRFIAYELGKEKPKVKKIFSTIVSIHILLAFIMFLLLESLGLWFLNYKMNIAADRISAANWVFQCSVITFCVNLISVPYNAALVAYEKMSTFAYISILEVSCKLAAVYALYIIPFDSLKVYAIFMLFIAVILRWIIGRYCTLHFHECRYNFTFDKNTFFAIFKFSGWNFIGSSAAILNNQGINILINLFFGVLFNATRGIANQVESAINSFLQNFMMALNPQITKSYAAGDYEYVNKMIITGTKVGYILFWIIALPVFLNINYILSIWLKEVPISANVFIRLGLLYNLFQSLSQCLYTAMLATGNIKKYQIIVGGLSILAFPLTYIFFEQGLPVEACYWSMIIFSVICLIARLLLMQGMIHKFEAKIFLFNVIIPLFLSSLIIFLIILFTHSFVQIVTFQSFFFESLECVIISAIIFYLFGINSMERKQVNSIVHFIKNKYKYE